MCGIIGFNWEDKHLLKKCMIKINHRGPNQNGTYIDKNISLGHLRLSILDLSINGKQPMIFEDFVISYNGEIYNFKEIKKKLEKKYRFQSQTDTEVILYAYYEWGDECFEKFNGMFSIALWNRKNKELILTRDRSGIKPLYYYHKKDKFIFSSEIKGFINLIPKKINHEALNRYFSLRYSPGEQTVITDVKKILPGQILKYKKNKIEFSTQPHNNKKEYKFFKNAFKELDSELKKTMKRQMISDVPVGAFLSGGLDSSLMVSLMNKSKDKPIKTFSVNFDDEDYGEGKYSRIMAESIGTEHKELTVNKSASDIIKKVCWHLDEPLGDAACIPTYMMSEETSKYVKVVLSGDGSDELFGGYPKYKKLKIKNTMNPVFKFAGNIIPNSNTKNRFIKKIIRTAKSPNKPHTDYWIYHEIYTLNERKNILKGQIYEKPYNFYKHTIGKSKYIDKIMAIDYSEWLPNDLMLKTDKMTMAHSLESRVPYLDNNIINIARRIPFKWKYRGNKEKYILKKIARNKIPEEIIKRKKQGFNIPLKSWLNNGLYDIFEQSLRENNIKIISKYEARKILERTKKKNPQDQHFWTLFMFQQWYDQFMEQQ
ncbi:asparagine synthase (glutamine-hydrolyzing) [Candidatus Woesearchaeota archaeon]|nr:asparagine synthase (glutamine-hydrolyzing) [Candidatus Woesearchaeota archaeon]MCF7900768.1 asparagine synthase (glutamine-hydrolyzing) [Candidatus Woesearchaeota archaeon]MCF8012933.1 asparagine synthase (glutamine-hydrolyzing) [Candidatus Woesearchaeota archaeon]